MLKARAAQPSQTIVIGQAVARQLRSTIRLLSKLAGALGPLVIALIAMGETPAPTQPSSIDAELREVWHPPSMLVRLMPDWLLPKLPKSFTERRPSYY